MAKKLSDNQKQFMSGVAVEKTAKKLTLKAALEDSGVQAVDLTQHMISKIPERELKIKALMDELAREQRAIMELKSREDFKVRLKFSSRSNPIFRDMGLKVLSIIRESFGMDLIKKFYTTELRAKNRAIENHNKKCRPEDVKNLADTISRDVATYDFGNGIGANLKMTFFEIKETDKKRSLTKLQFADLYRGDYEVPVFKGTSYLPSTGQGLPD